MVFGKLVVLRTDLRLGLGSFLERFLSLVLVLVGSSALVGCD